MELKDWIRAARKRAGLTQEQLGERLGLTKGNVSAWENARHEPSYAQLQEISSICGMPLPATDDKHKTSAADASIRGQNRDVIKEPPTSRSHRIREPSVESDDANVLPRDVPVLSYEKAGQMTAMVDPKTLGEPLGWETIHKPFSLATFAVPIRDASMHPKFEVGRDFPIIDPARAPSPGKFALARLRTGEAVFRKYRELGMNEHGDMAFELVPLNDDFATLHSERDGLAVIGTMVAYTHYEEE